MSCHFYVFIGTAGHDAASGFEDGDVGGEVISWQLSVGSRQLTWDK